MTEPDHCDHHDDCEADEAYVQQVVGTAINNMACYYVAVALKMPEDVTESWINTIWNTLRRDLDGEQRLLAVIRLLDGKAQAQSRALLHPPVGVHSGP